MSRLVRRLFAQVFHTPRPPRKLRRAADLRTRLMVSPLENRVVPTVFTVTTAGESGAGTLRQAILDANANAGADTITFNIAGTNNTISLFTGELAVTDSVAINGPGASKLTVDANNISRV